MFVAVLCTLCRTCVADVRTETAHLIDVRTATRHGVHGCRTNVGTVEIQPDAGGQLADVLLGQTRSGTVQTLHVTGGASVNALLIVLMGHVSSPWAVKIWKGVPS